MRAPSRRTQASTYRRRSGRPKRGPTLRYPIAGSGEQHARAIDRWLRRVSRAEIAKIDNRRETSFADQQIARVKVAAGAAEAAGPYHGGVRTSRLQTSMILAPSTSAIESVPRTCARHRHDRPGKRTRGIAWCICRGGLDAMRRETGRAGRLQHRITTAWRRGRRGAGRRENRKRRPGRPIRTGTGTGGGRREAACGSQRCSCSIRHAAAARRGRRTARSSPRRYKFCPQPEPTSTIGDLTRGPRVVLREALQPVPDRWQLLLPAVLRSP